MVKRWVPFVVACCIAGRAAPAAAQFTSSVIPPPAPARDSLERIVVRTDSVSRPSRAPDSSAAATLSSMKVWVDSAATALGSRPPGAPPDTTGAAAPPTARAKGRPPARPGDTISTRAAGGEVTRFRSGAPAPATATPLPLLALLGVGSVVAGALLRRR